MSPADVVIVGGGSAGAVLAARLSEDAGRRVVLIEAGAAPPQWPSELTDAGTVRGAVPGHPANWSYPALLTPHRPYTIARGRILGGSSTINGGSFVRARPEDFDAWAAAGNTDWSYERVLPTWRALERDLDFGEGPWHGGSGPIPVARAWQDHPAARAFADACLELGFPSEPDKNAPGIPGVGPVPRNVVDGVRWNTGMAYLDAARHRPNLVVLDQATAMRVVISEGRAVGVEIDRRGERHRIDAGEVVVSAGAVASAQLLLLSGIGDPDALRPLGIAVTSPRAGVGQSFTDHPSIALNWLGAPPLGPSAPSESFVTVLNFASPTEATSGAGDLEILLSVKSSAELLGDEGASPRELTLLIGLQAPQSRGTIGLRSPDPHDHPRIEYRYLSAPADRERLRHGIRIGNALLRSRAMRPLFVELTEGLEDAVDDEALDAWMLAHLGTAYHLSGSARMGAESDPGAVVDQHGNVHGIAALRVADTSILPFAPSRGSAATAVLIGELVARFIRDGR